MATTTLRTVCRHLRKLAGAPDAATATDSQLLQRFLRDRDEAAFAALVKRHGGLVLGVCRRVLGNHADAEDAFQATFLVLAKRATSIRSVTALASWLYGTAYRCALEIRRKAERRRTHEGRARPAAQPNPELEAALRELQALLDEEVQRLPEKYRAPFVLCALEGLSKAEAARELGWKEGTVSGRLAQARERLRQRLARRGVTLSAALCTLALSRDAASAAVPPMLAEATIRAAVLLAAGQGISAGTRVAAVVREMTRGVVFSRTRPLLALVLAVGIAVAGTGALERPGQTANPPGATPAPSADLQAPEARQPGTDALGDPLPAGAVARLGTARLRHGSALKGVAFLPGGQRLASTGLDNVLRLWEFPSGKLLQALRPPGGFAQAFCLAASPDGKTVAVAGNDRAITLWDTATGKLRDQLKGHEGPVSALAFSPDGAKLASGGWDKTLRLWDVATGNQLRRLEGHTEAVMAVGFSSDGNLLASGSGDRTARLWDPVTGRELRRLEGHGHSIMAVAFTPYGKTLATASGDKVIRLWDPATGKGRGRLEGHGDWIRSIAFSPNGKLLASAAATFGQSGIAGELKLWDVAARKALPRLGDLRGPFESVAFSPDGKTLAAGASHNNHIRLWDVATGKELSPPGHLGSAAPASVSADGKRALIGSYAEHVLRLWDAETGRELRRFRGDQGVLLPDGKTVLAILWSEPSVLHVWDAGTGKERRQVPRPVAGRFVAFAGDGKLAASASSGGVLAVWRTDTGKELHRLKGPAGRFTPLVFSADARRLAAAAGGTVTVWDVASGRELRSLDADAREVRHLGLSADGRLLATGNFRDRARLWDLATGTEMWRLTPEGEPNLLDLHHPTFSPDGRTLVTGGWDNAIVLWEVATGKRRSRLEGHQGWINGFAFSRDGRRMVTGSSDTTALVWDLTSGPPGKAELSGADLNGLWGDLAGADAARAYRAVLKLTAGAAQAVPFLREHLKPAPRGDGERVARLVADLGSCRFATRQKAMSELEKLGAAAESPLREALKKPLTAEVQLRVRNLLDRVDAQAAAARLRLGRALEVLERAGTPEARRLLRALAAGAPGAWLTEEARKALRRVE
jgi:RNA polymerase sigma factor (sigma-70 family)